jgi:hypothetical protein
MSSRPSAWMIPNQFMRKAGEMKERELVPKIFQLWIVQYNGRERINELFLSYLDLFKYAVLIQVILASCEVRQWLCSTKDSSKNSRGSTETLDSLRTQNMHLAMNSLSNSLSGFHVELRRLCQYITGWTILENIKEFMSQCTWWNHNGGHRSIG